MDTSHWSPAPAVTYTIYRSHGTTVEEIAHNLGGLSYTDNDVTPGETHTYQVTAVVAGGEAAHSAWVSATPKVNNPAAGVPTINGMAQAGETLTANTSGITDADGLNDAEFSYQWLADDVDIQGATDSTYTLSDA